MDLEFLKKLLDGKEYTCEMDEVNEIAVKNDGIVILFGGSDDLMEFRGAINDEVGSYDGGEAYLTEKGLLVNECSDSDCPYFEKEKEKAHRIEAVWDRDGIPWQYETTIPHITFNIMENGKIYCKGIIFELADAKVI